MEYYKRKTVTLGVLVSLIIVMYMLVNNSVTWISSHSKTPRIMNNDVCDKCSHMMDPRDHASIKTPCWENRNRSMVVVLAYMHTGSSFLGSILQHHHCAFYEYEKLRSLAYSTHAGKVIHFLNETQRNLTPHPNKLNVHHNVDPHIGAEAVKNMVTCNHDKLDIATLANHYYNVDLKVMEHVKDFFVCQEKEFGSSTKLTAKDDFQYVENKMLDSTNRTKAILRPCLRFLTGRCRNSSLVAEKFIRMTMEMAEILLKDLPDVKIIHLVRDPRAMLDSQVRRGNNGANKHSVFLGRAQYMCNQMVNDLKLARKLKTVHPDNIQTIRYEDLIQTTMPVVQDMFHFIDVPLTRDDEYFILKYSKNSLVWREHLSKANMDIVDTYCNEVYKMLGYVKFDSRSDLLDLKREHFVPISLK